jgi:hypothetical protein
VDDRYERGLDAYASQFGIPRADVPQWFTDRYGERFGTEAINAAGGAWADDALSLRTLRARGMTPEEVRAGWDQPGTFTPVA